MSLGGAFIYYGVRLLVFAIVAAVGIWGGMKIRKTKNSKNSDGNR